MLPWGLKKQNDLLYNLLIRLFHMQIQGTWHEAVVTCYANEHVQQLNLIHKI